MSYAGKRLGEEAARQVPRGAAGRPGEPAGASRAAEAPAEWLAAARGYATALADPRRRDAASVLYQRLAVHDPALLAAQLASCYRRLAAGDVLLVEAPGATRAERGGIGRAALAQALFDAGFERPLTWAGRAVLRAEPLRRWPARLLPAAALGAGPRQPLGVPSPLAVASSRIVALARRGAAAPPAERTLRLSVILPVYNERATFEAVMDRLLAFKPTGFDIDIIVVESNSSDGTREAALRYAERPRVQLILEDRPLGKGHAVRAGLAAATGDIVLIQDADLEYDLDDYPVLLAPLRAGRTGFVLGSRHLPGERFWQVRQFAEHPMAARLLNLGHLLFAGLLNLAFGQRMRDPFTMFKVFRRDAVAHVRFACDRFDFDIELVAKLIRQGYTPLEIDIHYRARSFAEGKKIRLLRDPPSWVAACLRHRFSRLHDWPAG
ncbi:MAG TPA: glycosyltransferase family 2 protein [Stellaceae bacterium]|nr:glycosyltransferase family 2 protein [Stellaceae bacterium]